MCAAGPSGASCRDLDTLAKYQEHQDQRPLEVLGREDIPAEAIRRALETGEDQTASFLDGWEFSVVYTDHYGVPVLIVHSSTMESFVGVDLDGLPLADGEVAYVEFFGGNHEIWKVWRDGFSTWDKIRIGLGGTGCIMSAAGGPAAVVVACGAFEWSFLLEASNEVTRKNPIEFLPWEEPETQ